MRRSIRVPGPAAALALLALLALLGAACGDDGDDVPDSAAEVDAAIEEAMDDAASGEAATDIQAAEPPELIDTCPLLTPEEIAAQFGERGTVGPAEDDLGEGSCRWLVGDLMGDGGWVFATHYPVDGMDPQQGLESVAGAAAAPEPVEGLGDSAIVSDEGADVLVWILQGSDVLAVSSRFEQPLPDARDRTLALAELVAERT